MESVKTEKSDDVVYPCLMGGGMGSVVLFTSENSGIMIHVGGSSNYFGQTTNWPLGNFTPYTGTVCLSN